MNSIIKVVCRFLPVLLVLILPGAAAWAQTAEIQWKNSTVSFDESDGSVDVTLVRNVNTTGLTTVYYRTVEGTATAGFDFQSVLSRQAIFTLGKEEITISTTINQDFQEEGSETYLLELLDPSPGANYSLGTNKQLTVTIEDDDVASVEWSEAVVHVGEDSNQVELTATRSASAGSLTVDFATVGGTATPILDYQSKSGSITFLPGQTQKSVLINLTDDILTETAEEFTVQLSDPNSGILGALNQIRVVIEDDESSSGTISWSVGSIQEVERNTVVQLSVQRTGGSQGSVSIQYATVQGTAKEGEDFTPTNGTLTWGNGSSTPRTVSVTLLDDSDDELDETFTLELSNLNGDASLGTASTIITIQDNDDPNSVGQVGFYSSSLIVDEAVGMASIPVQRVGGSFGAIEVAYEFSDSTATNGTDFSGVNGSLQWTDGNSEDKFIVIPILDDATAESDESFFITLTADEGEVTLLQQSSINVVIESDDLNNPGTIVFAANTQTVSESVGTFTVAVQRIGGATGDVSVAYETMERTAIASADYFTQVGVLNWSDGDATNKDITLSIRDDQLFEGDETFSIQLRDTPGGSVAGVESLHTVTIEDDELQPGSWFEFPRILFSGTESALQVEIQVERFGDGLGPATVRVQSDNIDAIAGVDYTALDEQLNWADGDLETKTAILEVLDDSGIEQNERVSLSLVEPSENALVGAISVAEVVIYDDDSTSGELVNLSTRGYVGNGDKVLIGGFIIWNGPQQVLIRAIGPSLQNVEGTLTDPVLQIVNNGDQTLVAENDNWTEDTSQIQPIIDTGLGDLNGFESAILKELPEGSYSALVSSNGAPGIGSVEIFVDVNAGLPGDLVNISTRGRVASGDEVLIGGLIIWGEDSKRLLFRGMGPSLIVPGASSLIDPELVLINQANGQIILSNDNWIDAANWDEIEATQLEPMESEAAMILELDPGAYTLQLRSATGGQGLGSVEIYGLN